MILEGRLTRVIKEAGLTRHIGGDMVWPPVNIEFEDPPAVLVESPRSEIRRENETLLQGDLPIERVRRIEADAERDGKTSALVVQIGGIAMYPAIIPPDADYHSIMQDISPADRVAYPIYEVIAEHRLPVIFHTGHSGMGTGMRGGGGVRLKWGQPMLVDDVAVDFPDMKIVLAHPSWPWVDESLSMALHKENVFIDLSGWSPKYFQPQIIQYANTQLRHKMLFGSDFPLIHPQKWIEAARQVGFKDEVLPGIMKDNAARLLGLT